MKAKRQRYTEEPPLDQLMAPAPYEAAAVGEPLGSEAPIEETPVKPDPGDSTQSTSLPPPVEEGTQMSTIASAQAGLVTLSYDGEAASANFPVWDGAGWVYVHAQHGRNTEPLPERIAKVLLESGKGFSVAT